MIFDAVLLDRDGTLIEDVPYNGDPGRVRPVPGARAALDGLRAAGLRLGVDHVIEHELPWVDPEPGPVDRTAVERLGADLAAAGAPHERDLTRRVAAPGALDLGGRSTWAELAGVFAGAAGVVVGNARCRATRASPTSSRKRWWTP